MVDGCRHAATRRGRQPAAAGGGRRAGRGPVLHKPQFVSDRNLLRPWPKLLHVLLPISVQLRRIRQRLLQRKFPDAVHGQPCRLPAAPAGAGGGGRRREHGVDDHDRYLRCGRSLCVRATVPSMPSRSSGAPASRLWVAAAVFLYACGPLLLPSLTPPPITMQTW